MKDPFSDFLSEHGLDFFSHFLSEFMGYLIIVGSAIMKVPQIMQIVKMHSVVGLNLSSLYFECGENIPIVIYNMIHVQSPFKKTFRNIPFLLMEKVFLS